MGLLGNKLFWVALLKIKGIDKREFSFYLRGLLPTRC